MVGLSWIIKVLYCLFNEGSYSCKEVSDVQVHVHLVGRSESWVVRSCGYEPLNRI
jgi:hypothetical protein